MDHARAQEWLDRYVEAWKSYDAAGIGALFGADVSYRYYAYAEPVRGRDAVVASWLGETDTDSASTRDAPGTYDASYAPVAVEGDVVVATGFSTYLDAPGGQVARVYDNCFLMRFDAAGQCVEFTEYYTRRP